MKTNFSAILIVIGILFAGCSSILEGTTQEIWITTEPSGVKCTLHRQDKLLAKIESTPQHVLVKKTKDDIVVICKSDDGKSVTKPIKSESSAVAFANIFASAGFGWVLDAVSGADNKYESDVHINLKDAVRDE